MMISYPLFFNFGGKYKIIPHDVGLKKEGFDFKWVDGKCEGGSFHFPPRLGSKREFQEIYFLKGFSFQRGPLNRDRGGLSEKLHTTKHQTGRR